MRRALEITGTLFAVLLAAMVFYAWLAEHDDHLRMQATVAAQKQLLDAADARERDRAATLKDTLTQIDALKHSVRTPAEILRDLPKYLPLPQPITQVASGAEAATQQGPATPEEPLCAGKPGCMPASASARPRSSKDTTPRDHPPSKSDDLPDAPISSAQIPSADLKPLYDYVQDCRACQVQLSAAKQNSADDATKLSALRRERDAALTAAKGGTFWRRLRRNAMWFAVGAGVGAVTLCSTGHCR